MITINAHKKAQAEEVRRAPPPPPPAPAPEVKVAVDNSYVVALIEKQQQQIETLARRMDSTISELADAVRKLEPGQGFSVTVTDWTHQGRIKSLRVERG